MLNVLPFVAGLVAGAAVVSALRGERARSVMQDTGARLRAVYDEAESGVRTVARSGFDLLRGVQPAPAGEAESAASVPPAVAPPATTPAKRARKPAARQAATAKPEAVKPEAVKPAAAKAKAARPPRKAKPEQGEA